jgi:hypothetical protein
MRAKEMWALTSKQGTAMPETALCENHVLMGSERGRVNSVAGFSPDWDGDPQMKECTENDQLACTKCGATTFWAVL